MPIAASEEVIGIFVLTICHVTAAWIIAKGTHSSCILAKFPVGAVPCMTADSSPCILSDV